MQNKSKKNIYGALLTKTNLSDLRVIFPPPTREHREIHSAGFHSVELINIFFDLHEFKLGLSKVGDDVPTLTT